MANYNIDAIYNGSTSLPGTERIRIDGAGNVGIGASTPLTRLFVSGSSSTNENLPTTYIRNSFPGTHGYGLSVSRNGSDTSALCFGSDSSLNSIIASNNTDLRIGKGQSNTFTEYIRINTNGNVGIGTSTVNYRLEVYNSGAENVAKFRGLGDTTIIIGGNDASSGEQYITYQNGTTNTQAWMVGMDDGEDFRFAYGGAGEITDGNSLVKIGQDGKVGIGTTSPAAKLEVNGNVKATSFTGSFSGLPNGYLYARRITSNQTISSGNWANIDLIFNGNVVSSSIKYNSSTGVATLTAGKVYKITSGLSWSNTATYAMYWSLYKNSNNAMIGPEVSSYAVTYNINTNSNGTLEMILVPTASIDVKIRTTANSSPYGTSLSLSTDNSYIVIQQLA